MGTLEHFALKVPIPIFNERIEQGLYRTEWLVRLSNIQQLISQYPQITWVVYNELEDNLTNRARSKLRHWTKIALKPQIQAIQGFNPIRPQHIHPLEIHAYNLNAWLRPGDVVSGDGVVELPSCGYLRWLKSRKVHYMFWQPDWQGASPKGVNKPASKRKYSMKKNKKAIMRLMKCGN